MKSAKFLILNSTFFILFACSPTRQGDEQQKGLSEGQLQKHLVNVNKIITDHESEDIDNFIKRHQWQMKTTGTGLRYEIYEKGNGLAPIKMSSVKLTGTLKLIDGTLCYEYTAEKPLVFLLSQGQQNNGLEEAIFLMHEYDKIRIIVPSHLGYGLLGDGNQIPSKAVLVYDLTLTSVQN